MKYLKSFENYSMNTEQQEEKNPHHITPKEVPGRQRPPRVQEEEENNPHHTTPNENPSRQTSEIDMDDDMDVPSYGYY